jgi:hypothetical protein
MKLYVIKFDAQYRESYSPLLNANDGTVSETVIMAAGKYVYYFLFSQLHDQSTSILLAARKWSKL